MTVTDIQKKKNNNNKTKSQGSIKDYVKSLCKTHLDVIYDKAYNKKIHRNLSVFNIMPAQLYWKILEDFQEESFTKNNAWNRSKVDVGTGYFAFLIVYLKKKTSLPFQSNTNKKLEL